jgi:hypothetical protein
MRYWYLENIKNYNKNNTMVTFTETIKKLEVEPSYNNQTNYVTAVWVEIEVSNGTRTIKELRRVSLNSSPDFVDTEFVEYAELTEEIVKGWLNSINEYGRIKDMLSRRINPPAPPIQTVEIRTELPWNV